MYTKLNEDGKKLIVCLYVDDLIFTRYISIDDFKKIMKREFYITDLVLMKCFLGIELTQCEDGIFICQSKYAKDILKRFRMGNYKRVVTLIAIGTKLNKDDHGSDIDPTLFKQLVGSLMYLTATRPDIMFGVSLISIFMESLRSTHWLVGRRILRYVVGTRNYGIMCASDLYFKLTRYIYSDFAGNFDDRRSTSLYVFSFGLGAVSWASVKQSIATLSSVEAEYVAATTTTCQTVWMRRILKELLHEHKEPTHIFCDNKFAIALSINHVFHKESKHIDTRYHFILELVRNNEICMEFCRSKDQFAEIFTKPLGK